MNNSVPINHLTKFTPAEVLIIQKGRYNNLREILRQMIHHFVLQNWLAFNRLGDVVHITDTRQSLAKENGSN